MRNLDAEKALANNHRSHQLIGNITYALPGGFQIGAVAQARSGLPWTVTTGTDNNRDTFTNPLVDRPDLAVPGGDPLDRATYNGTFTGRAGNLGRNTVIGPNFFRLDARVSKFIQLRSMRLEAFAEAFNLTNRPNFQSPGSGQLSSLRSATFGRPSAIVGNMRQVEIGFRFDF
ncbi:MAG: hypothetical protein LC791_05275 [Acidobacteria bacterium]|nr:hypothetical protein [Acidobacteriota bacterium]